MIFDKDDHVYAKIDILLTAPPSHAGRVIPAGTGGVVLSVLTKTAKVEWAFEGFTVASVERGALVLAEAYWMQRARRAEAILDNLASLATFHGGKWIIDSIDGRRIEQIVFQLAKERRGE